MILKGDLKGFPENFETKDRIPPAVSGPDGENTARSWNQSDCRICRIPPAHELRKKINVCMSQRSVIGLKTWHHFVNQSDSNLETWSPALSRAFGRLRPGVCSS